MFWTETLESQFDSPARERGESYERQGRVRLLRATDDDAEAVVRGTRSYQVLVYEYLDGRTRDRAARVQRFQTDESCRVFLISLKTGGLGVNLTSRWKASAERPRRPLARSRFAVRPQDSRRARNRDLRSP